MLGEIQEVWILLAWEGVEVDGEEASGGIIHIDLEQEFVVLKSSSEAAFLAEDVDELEYRHKEAGWVLIIDDVFFDERFFDELQQVIASSHLVNVYHSLNEIVGLSVVALKSEKLSDRVKAIHMLRVHLAELEKGIHIIRVPYYVIFFLNWGIFFAGLESNCVVLLLNIEFLFQGEVLSYSWR